MNTVPAQGQRFQIRTYRRIPLQATAFFVNEQVRARGFVWNLSLDGCRIDAEKDVQEGTEVSLMLYLPEGVEPVEVESAVVAWSRGHELGFRWQHIGTLDAARLSAYLRTIL
jgi:hypothetical protein